MKWIVEGTASWSQKFTNQSLRDYMARMNSGLRIHPTRALITERSYDACHFWTYLQEQASTSAIKDVWVKYQANGLKAKEASRQCDYRQIRAEFRQVRGEMVQSQLPQGLGQCHNGGYDYDENDITQKSCGATYGPLRQGTCHCRRDH